MKLEDNMNKGGKAIEHGKTFLADHITSLFTVVAIAALVIYRLFDPAVILKVTQFSNEIIIDFAISFVFVMTLWSNMSWQGRQYGLKTQKYIGAQVYFSGVYDAISRANRLKDIGDFVPKYIKARLESYQRTCVSCVGIDWEDFTAHYQHMNTREIKGLEYKIGKEPKDGTAGEIITQKQKAAIIRALRVKPIKLTEDKLIRGVNKRYDRNVVGKNEAQLTATGTATKSVRWIVTTAITTFWGFEKFDMLVSGNLADIMLMMGVITMAIVSGWLKGYNIITTGVVRNLTARADILKVMCEWNEIPAAK